MDKFFCRRRFLQGSMTALGWTTAQAVLPTGICLCRASATKPSTDMKYAICNETFGDWPQEKVFRFAAECGYRGVEIAPFTIATNVAEISPKQRATLRRQAAKAGVEIIGLHWLLAKTEGLHVTSADREVRRKTAQYLGALAEFCAELGGKIMVFGSPQQRNLASGVSHEEGMKYAAEVLQAAMPACEKAGVTIALEPLSTKETNFLTTAAEGVELLKLVDSAHCRLHLDCKAMASESTPIPALIRKNRPWLVHFHANDPNLQGPGMGELDFVPIFQALREIGYDGWISVEVFDYTPGPERLARESIRYMREVEQKLAPAPAAKVTVERNKQGAAVKIDGKPFAEYLIDSGGKPILWPILGPSGIPLTRAWPMAKAGPHDPLDHPHQRSLWFTHGDVNGISFWHELPGHGTIKHREFVKQESGLPGVIVTRNDWLGPDGRKVCEDERTLRFGVDGDNRWIDFDITLKATTGPVTFGDTKEGAFGLRLTGSMTVDAKLGGAIVNSRGQKNDRAWGQPAEWVDYHGPIDGQTFGIAVLNHPDSFRFPTCWHVRDYGLFAANPFGLHDFTAGKKNGSYTLPAGESLTLRYRLWLHRGDEHGGRVTEAFAAYALKTK